MPAETLIQYRRKLFGHWPLMLVSFKFTEPLILFIATSKIVINVYHDKGYIVLNRPKRTRLNLLDLYYPTQLAKVASESKVVTSPKNRDLLVVAVKSLSYCK